MALGAGGHVAALAPLGKGGAYAQLPEVVTSVAQPKHSQAQQPPPQAQQPPSQAQQPPSRAEQGQPAPSPSRQHSERPRERGSSSLANAAILVGVGAVLASIFSAPSEQGPAPAINDDYLARNGPRFAVTQKVGTFVVEGYIHSGWPFVVDFLPQPDTCTELDVYLGGKLKRDELPPAHEDRPKIAPMRAALAMVGDETLFSSWAMNATGEGMAVAGGR